MSLAEVSKSMGELAAAITKKNQELDQLKREYERKLHLVETYIQHFPLSESSTQNSSEFIRSLATLEQNPVTCPSCSSTLFDLQQASDFVLVPKSRLRLEEQAGEERSTGITELPETPDGSDGHVLPTSNSRPHQYNHNGHNSSNKSKRTCSYCNKPGHSRARCFTRLSREPQ